MTFHYNISKLSGSPAPATLYAPPISSTTTTCRSLPTSSPVQATYMYRQPPAVPPYIHDEQTPFQQAYGVAGSSSHLSLSISLYLLESLESIDEELAALEEQVQLPRLFSTCNSSSFSSYVSQSWLSNLPGDSSDSHSYGIYQLPPVPYSLHPLSLFLLNKCCRRTLA